MALAVPQYSSFFQCLYDQPDSPSGGCWGGYSVFRAIDSRDVCQHPTRTPRVHDFAVIWDEDHDTRIIPVVEEMLMAGMLPGVQFIGERKGYISVILAAPTHSIDTEAYARRVTEFTDLLLDDPWTCEIGMFENTPSSLRTEHQCELGSLVYADAPTAHAFLLTIDKMWGLGTKEYVSADEQSRTPFRSRYQMRRPLKRNNEIPPLPPNGPLFGTPQKSA